MKEELQDIDITQPKFDQTIFWGRAQHFFAVTNPLNILLSSDKLERAKRIITDFKKGKLEEDISVDELWEQKYIYDSAFHPDTGEKLLVIGRMSAQVPMNMIITGGMMSFYKTNPAILFWQWCNQSFNAVVNYSNRSGDAPISIMQLGTTYVLATTGAIATAMALNNYAKRLPPIAGRFVPFVAVAAANLVNIPCMRWHEVKVGTPIIDEDGNRYGESKTAAKSGIGQVIFSRICMAAPSMMLCPIIMDQLEKRGQLQRRPWINMPVQLVVVGFCLTFATPLACAFFKQRAEIKYSSLEKPIQEEIQKRNGSNVPQILYFNKGL